MSDQGAVLHGEAPAWIRLRDLLQQAAEGCGAVQISVREELTALLPAESTRRALAALAQNVAAASNGKPVELGAEIRGGRLVFTVRDEGCGMNAETLRHIAEPFFTTRPAGQGMGLGTFLARIFAGNLGGSLVFESAPDKGTTVTMELPDARTE
jgi:two-component system sensor histidine kinase RegB